MRYTLYTIALLMFFGCEIDQKAKQDYLQIKADVEAGNYAEAEGAFANFIINHNDSHYRDSVMAVLDQIPRNEEIPNTEANTSTTSSTYTSGVEGASEKQIAYVNEGLTDGITAENIKSYKSDSHEQAYFVSAHLSGRGLNKQFACWLISGTRDNPGMILSVDSWADEYSVFPQNRDVASVADNGYSILKRTYVGE